MIASLPQISRLPMPEASHRLTLASTLAFAAAATPTPNADAAGSRLLTHTGERMGNGVPLQRVREVHLNDFNDLAYIRLGDSFGDFDDPSVDQLVHTPLLGGFEYEVSDDVAELDQIDFSNSNRVAYSTDGGVYRNRPSTDPDESFNPVDVVIAEDLGDTSPDNRLTNYDFNYREPSEPAINNRGHVAFTGGVRFDNGERGNGLFLGKPGGGANALALTGDRASGADAEFRDFETPAINNSRQVATAVTLGGGRVDATNDVAVYLFDQPSPGSSQSILAREGRDAPDRQGFHFADINFTTPAIDDSGRVLFGAGLANDAGEQAAGLYEWDGAALNTVVASGDPLPGEPSRSFVDFNGTPVIDGDYTLFAADVTGDFFTRSSLYVANTTTAEMDKVFVEGASVPNGDGEFDALRQYGMNDMGEVAFKASLRNYSQDNIILDPGPNEAIFFRSGSGELHEVVREGQKLLGKTVYGLELAEGGPNNDGEVVFSFELRELTFQGLAAWSEDRTINITNRHFEDRSGGGVPGWSTGGVGSTSTSPDSDGDVQAVLTSGSPVFISQDVGTPDAPIELAFEFRFVDGAGTLEVALDGMPLTILEGDEYGVMNDTEQRVLHLVAPRLRGLSSVPLTFSFDSPNRGDRLRLDDVSMQSFVIPTPLHGAIPGLAWLAMRPRRRRHSAVSSTAPPAAALGDGTIPVTPANVSAKRTSSNRASPASFGA